MRGLSRTATVCVAVALAACGRGETQRALVSSPDTVVVRISYGSEKKAFLTDSIEVFHRSSPKTSGGRPIRIEALAEGSAESMESILGGRNDIAVWSPASSLLVDVLNDRWTEAHASLGERRPLV